jgi:hypothetical protein
MNTDQNKLEAMLVRERMAKCICAELNNFVDLKPALMTIIGYVKTLSGFQAVSIRLHNEGDFPYYVYDGFPESFIQKENSLCAKDDHGSRIPSPDGRGCLLECMCGNVIRGLITICARCKKVKDGKGYWKSVETYIVEHSEAEFSHSYCPEWYKEAMKEVDDFEISGKQNAATDANKPNR